MPFYSFNSLTGRVSSSKQQTAYNPVGLQADLPESEPAQFSSKSIQAVPVEDPATIAAAAAEMASAKGVIPTHPGYQRVLELQKKWNVNDGLMVWQKRGMVDRVPFVATYGIMMVGLAYGLSLIWKMSWPKPVPQD